MYKRIYLFTFFTFLYFVGINAQSSEDWVEYKDAIIITETNAHGISSFDNTPESVVNYFYASLIRDDEDWNLVVPKKSDRSDRLKSKLAEYTNWTIHSVQITKNQKKQEAETLIKVKIDLEYKGKRAVGELRVTLSKIKQKWIITDLTS